MNIADLEDFAAAFLGVLACCGQDLIDEVVCYAEDGLLRMSEGGNNLEEGGQMGYGEWGDERNWENVIGEYVIGRRKGNGEIPLQLQQSILHHSQDLLHHQ